MTDLIVIFIDWNCIAWIEYSNVNWGSLHSWATAFWNHALNVNAETTKMKKNWHGALKKLDLKGKFNNSRANE